MWVLGSPKINKLMVDPWWIRPKLLHTSGALVTKLLSSFFFSTFFLSPWLQSHSDPPRTDPLQGCSGPAALRARRWVAAAKAACIFPPMRSHPHRHPHLSPPIIVHHALWNVRVRMNHRLSSAPSLSSSPLSNEADRDSWMFYIAILIPAYAKRSFTLLSPPAFSSLSISPWWRFALPGWHFLHQLLSPGLPMEIWAITARHRVPAECL